MKEGRVVILNEPASPSPVYCLRNAEIANGRLAMMAIIGMFFQEQLVDVLCARFFRSVFYITFLACRICRTD